MSNAGKHIVVIGAGVIGLSVALQCARRGHRVTVIERSPARRGGGASFGNAGMIVPSHFIPLAAPGAVRMGLKWMLNPASPFYIKPRLDAGLLGWLIRFCAAANPRHVERCAPLLRDLSLASRECLLEFAAEPGVDFGLVTKGLLMLCQTEHALHEEAQTAHQASALGIPAHILDAKAAAELDPAARMEIAGAVHFPLDCHLAPDRLMAALLASGEKLGVDFLWESEVLDFKTGAKIDAVTLAGRREIGADEFVVCGGAWSPGLARKLSLRLPMEAGKGYSITLPNPRRLPQLCSILTEARVAITPMGGALRVGGTMEIAGLNEKINPVRVRSIIEAFCRYYPEFSPADFADVAPWCGLRPCSPDGLPYVGRTARFPNLSLATGHAMMGVSLASVTGRLMAEILSGEEPSINIAMLNPDRYH